MDLLTKIRFKLSSLFYKHIGKSDFKFFGNSVLVFCPLKINGQKYIELQDGVKINYRCWIEANADLTSSDIAPRLYIGKNTVIGNYNHIFATKSIEIGDNVLIADKVYISDNLHEYEDIHTPILYQPIKQIKPVKIGDGSWIGENVCILGVEIGKQVVIAANSVVTKDIPSYCIAGGVPARIIKRYNVESKKWENEK